MGLRFGEARMFTPALLKNGGYVGDVTHVFKANDCKL